MLNTIQKILMIAVAAFSTGAIGQAQSIKVDVPFEFQAGDTRLAAGVYDISRFLGQNATVYTVRSESTSKTIGLLAQQHSTAKVDSKPMLQFRCVAGQCQLAKIEIPGSGTSTFNVNKRNAEAAGQKVAFIRVAAL